MVFAEQFTDVETKTEVLGMAGSHVLRMVRSRRGSRALCEKGLNGLTNRIFVKSVPVVGYSQQQPVFRKEMVTKVRAKRTVSAPFRAVRTRKSFPVKKQDSISTMSASSSAMRILYILLVSLY